VPVALGRIAFMASKFRATTPIERHADVHALLPRAFFSIRLARVFLHGSGSYPAAKQSACEFIF